MADQSSVNIHPIVRQIIDRDCHVCSSNREVIRHVIDQLRDGWTTFKEMPPTARKDLLRQCIERHRQNREEYEAVMGGWTSVGMKPPGF